MIKKIKRAIKKLGELFKKFMFLNLVFGIGLCCGSAIGTAVTLSFYGTPEISIDQLLHNCETSNAD